MVQGSRPGAAGELGGKPISRLLPGPPCPAPCRDSLGGDPRLEGAPSGAPGAVPMSLGARGGPGGVPRLQSAPAVSLHPVHWTPVSLRTQVTEGGTRPMFPTGLRLACVHPVHALLLSAPEQQQSADAAWRWILESLRLDGGASGDCQGRHL